jgi:hypothetical protein
MSILGYLSGMISRITLPALVVGVLVSLVLSLAPTAAQADMAMPAIRLTGGAAEVTATYTASTPDYTWPSGVTARYSWYRGDRDGDTTSFVPIYGATNQRYTLTDADHTHTIRVRVRAIRGGEVVGEKWSPSSNWVMYEVTAPVLSGTGYVGETITGKLGIWATEWWVTIWWRRGEDILPDTNSLTYKAVPIDAGKSISMVGLGEYEFPNGVHPIDRRVTHQRVRWEQTLLLKASSSGGNLNVSMNSYARRATQVQGSGRVTLYDGSRVLKEFWLTGHRLMTFTGMAKGAHTLKLVFPENNFFSGKTVSTPVTIS